MQNIGFSLGFLSLVMLVLSLIFMLGIIWRVELKLDKAYKIMFIALSCLVISKALELFVILSEKVLFISQIFSFFFALFLLIGLGVTRNLFRNIDGEK